MRVYKIFEISNLVQQIFYKKKLRIPDTLYVKKYFGKIKLIAEMRTKAVYGLTSA